MRLPRDVARYLEDWSYYPLHREDFGSNYLSRHVSPARDRAQGDFEPRPSLVSLCAVPRGALTERVGDIQAIANWLEPNSRQYQPPGVWLPFRNGKRFTSHGVLLFEEDPRSRSTPAEWEAYVLVARDGYVEFGRQAGFPYKGNLCYQFAPLVAWFQRFVAFIGDAASQFNPAPDYHLVLNIGNSEGAVLCALGEGWSEPWDWHDASRIPRSLESHTQIARAIAPKEPPAETVRWFAERIANAFGEGEVRCFNRVEPVGELPSRKLEF